MINTIILDIGQVLANFRWESYLEECNYDEETKDKVSKATVLGPMWKEVDRGILSEEEIVDICTKQDPSVAKEIAKLFKDSTQLVREFSYSAEFVKNLKSNGYKVYLLSNYGKKNFEYAKDHFEFFNYVEEGIISYEVKSIKPESPIYEALIEKYNINPNEALFLDDSIANLDAAKEFGFHTIHVQEFDKAIDELRGLGIEL